MPKRLIDGEALWTSQKLKKLSPKFRAEYANILPLAKADGVFDYDPGLIWRTVYAFNRPEISKRFVERFLSEMCSVGLIFTSDFDGKTFGYFPGIEKVGRLPPKSERYKYERSGLNENQLAILSRQDREGIGLDRNGMDVGCQDQMSSGVPEAEKKKILEELRGRKKQKD